MSKEEKHKCTLCKEEYYETESDAYDVINYCSYSCEMVNCEHPYEDEEECQSL